MPASSKHWYKFLIKTLWHHSPERQSYQALKRPSYQAKFWQLNTLDEPLDAYFHQFLDNTKGDTIALQLQTLRHLQHGNHGSSYSVEDQKSLQSLDLPWHQNQLQCMQDEKSSFLIPTTGFPTIRLQLLCH